MRAYKFMRKGAIGPFTEHRFVIGEWVDAIEFPRRGVHALTVDQLPYWLDDELWIVELAAPIVERPTQIVASRARIVERVEGWDDDVRAALLEDVVKRGEARVERADVGWTPSVASNAFATPNGLADALEGLRADARRLAVAAPVPTTTALLTCFASLLGAAARGASATGAFIASALAALAQEGAGTDGEEVRRSEGNAAARAERADQAAFLARALELG